jgi:hypothetical protein
MKKRRKYIDILIFSPPKHMCTNCFRIFSKRYSIDSCTQRCTCGSDELVRLDREVPIPRKKAGNKKWEEFFRGYMALNMI